MTTRSLVVIGARASFTATVLSTLVALRAPPVALLLHSPRARAALPVRTAHEVDRLAAAGGVAVRDVASARDAVAAATASGASAALVACYPRRLPVTGLPLPPDGLFNLHPSPLPAYRGPSPLFWQFRAGAPRAAVSLHRVSPAFDAGAILGQAWIDLAPGDDFSAVNARLAALGAELAVEHLLRPSIVAAGESQHEACASAHGPPLAVDFQLSPDWPAERLYRFVAGTAAWSRSFRLRAADGEYHVDGVLGFEPQGVQSKPVLQAPGERLWIRCRPGVVHALGGRVT